MATPRSAKKASRKSGSKSAKAGLIFPVGRVGAMMRRGQYARRIGASGAVYLTAVLEYLTAELLELSVKAAAQSGKKRCRLNPRTVMLAVRHDDDIGASEERDPVPQRRGAEHQQGDGEEKGGKKGKATPSA
ncbi:histone H2A, putative [Leishmania tarentolae]|uniref:Histone H2A n=1 Tax=Leishmania tarentolae TaxID=5689 RepID=A0A640KW27_LEITA|nr:histone H2A, putative [Leishmania tarentolae]